LKSRIADSAGVPDDMKRDSTALLDRSEIPGRNDRVEREMIRGLACGRGKRAELLISQRLLGDRGTQAERPPVAEEAFWHVEIGLRLLLNLLSPFHIRLSPELNSLTQAILVIQSSF